MADAVSYQQMGTAARGQAHTLFAQTMGYVAVTAALFAAGAWLGRDLTGAVGLVAWIASFAVLISMRFAARRSVPLTVVLLAASIFLDVLNVFLFFLDIFSGQER
jgi:uncharacterized protein